MVPELVAAAGFGMTAFTTLSLMARERFSSSTIEAAPLLLIVMGGISSGATLIGGEIVQASHPEMIRAGMIALGALALGGAAGTVHGLSKRPTYDPMG